MLEINYRSAERICEAANAVISHNTTQVDKRLVPTRPGGKIVVKCVASPGHEAAYVLQQIIDLQPETCAVLARTNRMVRAIATHLQANGVAVASVKRPKLPHDWMRAMALLAAIAQPTSDTAILRFLRIDQGAEAAKIKTQAVREQRSVASMMDGAFDVDRDSVLRTMGNKFLISFESRTLLESVDEPGMDILGLLAAASEIGKEEEGDGTGVFVSTIHGAKGLEFNVVFVVGFEEGLIPFNDGPGLEEERRLFYVAATRAIDRLELLHCESRPQYRGQNMPIGPDEPKTISRFAREMAILPPPDSAVPTRRQTNE